MRRFHLDRDTDVSGVSGTGIVAEGVVFSDGTTVIMWLGDRPSVVTWRRFSDAESVHGHGGHTRFVFQDEEEGLAP